MTDGRLAASRRVNNKDMTLTHGRVNEWQAMEMSERDSVIHSPSRSMLFSHAFHTMQGDVAVQHR